MSWKWQYAMGLDFMWLAGLWGVVKAVRHYRWSRGVRGRRPAGR